MDQVLTAFDVNRASGSILGGEFVTSDPVLNFTSRVTSTLLGVPRNRATEGQHTADEAAVLSTK